MSTFDKIVRKFSRDDIVDPIQLKSFELISSSSLKPQILKNDPANPEMIHSVGGKYFAFLDFLKKIQITPIDDTLDLINSAEAYPDFITHNGSQPQNLGERILSIAFHPTAKDIIACSFDDKTVKAFNILDTNTDKSKKFSKLELKLVANVSLDNGVKFFRWGSKVNTDIILIVNEKTNEVGCTLTMWNYKLLETKFSKVFSKEKVIDIDWRNDEEFVVVLTNMQKIIILDRELEAQLEFFEIYSQKVMFIEKLIFTCGIAMGSFKCTAHKISAKKKLHKYQASIIDLPEMKPTGSIFSFYDKSNKLIYVGTRFSRNMFCINFCIKSNFLNYFQSSSFDCHIASIAIAPNELLNDETIEIAKFWVFGKENDLEMITYSRFQNGETPGKNNINWANSLQNYNGISEKSVSSTIHNRTKSLFGSKKAWWTPKSDTIDTYKPSPYDSMQSSDSVMDGSERIQIHSAKLRKHID